MSLYIYIIQWYNEKAKLWGEKKLSGSQWGGKMNMQNMRIFRALSVIKEWWIHTIIHLSKPIDGTKRSMNPNVNFEL